MDTELSDLVQAIREQTKAINALVQSNAALIQAMAEQDIEEAEPTSYLDGTRTL